MTSFGYRRIPVRRDLRAPSSANSSSRRRAGCRVRVSAEVAAKRLEAHGRVSGKFCVLSPGMPNTTSPTRAGRAARHLALTLAFCVLLAACGGGNQAADNNPNGNDTPDTSTTSAAVDSAGSGRPEGESTTTVPEPDEPPQPDEPEILPVGAWWEPVSAEGDIGFGPLVVLGDELWSLGRRFNAPVVHRTTDGYDWQPISIVAPPSRGSIDLDGILSRPDGGYLAWGSRRTSCQTAEDVGGGFLFVGLCRQMQPILFLSEDGVTWRSVEPSGLAPPSGSSSELVDVIVDPNGGYLAAGTVRGADWHARVWRSDDGETWSLVHEVRGADGPTSSEKLATDGSSILLVVSEHPCSKPKFNTPGWTLGSGWASHPRLYLGPSAADLTLQTPGDLPLAAEPMVVDCATQTGYEVGREPYTEAMGSTLGGKLIVAGRPPRQTSEDPLPGLQIWRLESDVWVDISPPQDPERPIYQGGLIDVDGMPGFVHLRRSPPHTLSIAAELPDVDGGLSAPDPRPVEGESTTDAVWFADGVYVSGFGYDDPFAERDYRDPLRQRVWRSVAFSVDDLPRCEFEAGAVCDLADATLHPDYPDLAAIDLSGSVLRWANCGGPDLTGADFTGAYLPVSTFYGTLVDADFTGASLTQATIGDGAGAVFAGTDLTDTRIELTAAPASLEGAVLRNVWLVIESGANGDYPVVELDLSGVDLTGANIRGPLEDGVWLVVTDLRGAIIDGTEFSNVDLSQANVEGVDLTGAEVWDDSICPDGLPPDDGPIGTCVRSE